MKTNTIIGIVIICLTALTITLIITLHKSPEEKIFDQFSELANNYQDKLVCEQNKLAKMGYTDGIDCIMESDNPVCDFDRYNAQVNADNECNG